MAPKNSQTSKRNNHPLASASAQKQAQECISLYCYIAMNKKGRMHQKDQMKYLFDAYHGKDGKASAILMFLNGEGRFAALWEGPFKELASCLPRNLVDKNGVRYNMHHFTVESLGRATGKSKVLLNGRGILNKAMKAIRACKKYYAIYISKLINGVHLPSGLNEEDMLQSVVKAIYIEVKRKNLPSTGEGDDDSSDSEIAADIIGPSSSTNSSNIQSLKDGNDNEEEDEEVDEENDDEDFEDAIDPTNDEVFGTEDDIVVPKYFIPLCFFSFFVFGPMSSEGVHDILSRGDDQHEEEDNSRSKKRQLAIEEAKNDRDSQPGRGMPDATVIKLALNREKLDLANFEFEKSCIMDERDGYLVQLNLERENAHNFRMAGLDHLEKAAQSDADKALAKYMECQERLKGLTARFNQYKAASNRTATNLCAGPTTPAPIANFSASRPGNSSSVNSHCECEHSQWSFINK